MCNVLQVSDMENILPLFHRFLSSDSTQYVVCIYKVLLNPGPTSILSIKTLEHGSDLLR